MVDEFVCPACGARSWIEVQNFVYKRKISEKSSTQVMILKRRIEDYLKILVMNKPFPAEVTVKNLKKKERPGIELLFSVWFPGKEEIILTSQVCSACSFWCYAPRPEDADLNRKYDFLLRAGAEVGGQKGFDRLALRYDSLRAERIFGLVAPYIDGKQKLRILDYGGGNGKLLIPFLRCGHECYTIDHNSHPVSGITWLGRTLDEIRDLQVYDIIILSHVLEHVAHPVDLLARLKSFLNEGGVLYVEIPLEVWAGIRIGPDPVTHINYFTTRSFLAAIRRSGCSIKKLESRFGRYGRSKLKIAWAIACSDESGGHVPAFAWGAGKKELNTRPGRAYSIGRLFSISVLNAIENIVNKALIMVSRAKKEHPL